jgi:hypothetical protein
MNLLTAERAILERSAAFGGGSPSKARIWLS